LEAESELEVEFWLGSAWPVFDGRVPVFHDIDTGEVEEPIIVRIRCICIHTHTHTFGLGHCRRRRNLAIDGIRRPSATAKQHRHRRPTKRRRLKDGHGDAGEASATRVDTAILILKDRIFAR
jgi:hypothetical protein